MKRADEKLLRKVVAKHKLLLEDVKENTKREGKKVEVLKHEIEAFEFRINDSQKKHEERIVKIEEELEKKKRMYHKMEKKMSKWNELSSGIVTLYFKTKDRSSQVLEFSNSNRVVDFDTVFRQEDDKTRQKLLKQNPLLTLDMLSANLRSLIDFRKRFREEMKSKINTKKKEASKQLFRFQDKVKELEKMSEEYLYRKNNALREKELAMDSMKETIQESTMTMRRLQKRNEKMIDEIKRSEDVLNNLYFKLDKKESLLRTREIEMHKINKLKSQRTKTLHKHRYDQNKMKSEIYQMLISYKRKFKHLKDLHHTQNSLQVEIGQKEIDIRDLYKESSREKVLKLVKIENKKLVELNSLEKERKELTKMNKINVLQIKKLEKDNKKRRIEKEKIEKILQKNRRREKMMKLQQLRQQQQQKIKEGAFNIGELADLSVPPSTTQSTVSSSTPLDSGKKSQRARPKTANSYFPSFNKLYSPTALEAIRAKKVDDNYNKKIKKKKVRIGGAFSRMGDVVDSSDEEKNELEELFENFVLSKADPEERARFTNMEDYNFDRSRDNSEYYKRKLKEKEKEVSKLKLRIQKMIQHERMEKKKLLEFFPKTNQKAKKGESSLSSSFMSQQQQQQLVVGKDHKNLPRSNLMRYYEKMIKESTVKNKGLRKKIRKLKHAVRGLQNRT